MYRLLQFFSFGIRALVQFVFGIKHDWQTFNGLYTFSFAWPESTAEREDTW